MTAKSRNVPNLPRIINKDRLTCARVSFLYLLPSTQQALTLAHTFLRYHVILHDTRELKRKREHAAIQYQITDLILEASFSVT